MPVDRISVNDLFGRAFIRTPGGSPIDGYFQTVEALDPLVLRSAFQEHVTGFYINISEGSNSVRLSYFTTNVPETLREIDGLVSEANLEKFNECLPRYEYVSQGYGGDELRFRRYLFLYTLMGLDLIRFDVLYSRRLAAEYRLTFSPQRASPRPLFESAFEKHSPTYMSLSQPLKDQLWDDLSYWHSEWEDWAHMLVNMLLPGDWIYNPSLQHLFRYPGGPIVGSDRQILLKGIGLDIPEDWGP